MADLVEIPRLLQLPPSGRPRLLVRACLPASLAAQLPRDGAVWPEHEGGLVDVDLLRTSELEWKAGERPDVLTAQAPDLSTLRGLCTRCSSERVDGVLFAPPELPPEAVAPLHAPLSGLHVLPSGPEVGRDDLLAAAAQAMEQVVQRRFVGGLLYRWLGCLTRFAAAGLLGEADPAWPRGERRAPLAWIRFAAARRIRGFLFPAVQKTHRTLGVDEGTALAWRRAVPPVLQAALVLRDADEPEALGLRQLELFRTGTARAATLLSELLDLQRAQRVAWGAPVDASAAELARRVLWEAAAATGGGEREMARWLAISRARLGRLRQSGRGDPPPGRTAGGLS